MERYMYKNAASVHIRTKKYTPIIVITAKTGVKVKCFVPEGS